MGKKVKVCVKCVVSSLLCLRLKNGNKRGNERSFIDDLDADI